MHASHPITLPLRRLRPAFLQLVGNRLTGPLPAAWGADASRLDFLSVMDNQLSGEAFPPAWLAPGAFPGLESITLDANPRLHGTLPANLSWPKLSML